MSPSSQLEVAIVSNNAGTLACGAVDAGAIVSHFIPDNTKAIDAFVANMAILQKDKCVTVSTGRSVKILQGVPSQENYTDWPEPRANLHVVAHYSSQSPSSTNNLSDINNMEWLINHMKGYETWSIVSTQGMERALLERMNTEGNKIVDAKCLCTKNIQCPQDRRYCIYGPPAVIKSLGDNIIKKGIRCSVKDAYDQNGLSPPFQVYKKGNRVQRVDQVCFSLAKKTQWLKDGYIPVDFTATDKRVLMGTNKEWIVYDWKEFVKAPPARVMGAIVEAINRMSNKTTLHNMFTKVTKQSTASSPPDPSPSTASSPVSSLSSPAETPKQDLRKRKASEPPESPKAPKSANVGDELKQTSTSSGASESTKAPQPPVQEEGAQFKKLQDRLEYMKKNNADPELIKIFTQEVAYKMLA